MTIESTLDLWNVCAVYVICAFIYVICMEIERFLK